VQLDSCQFLDIICLKFSNERHQIMRILYYGGGWPTNIGNSFIDLGAMALLRAAVPTAEIAFASEMLRWFYNYGLQKPKRLTRRWLYKKLNTSNYPVGMNDAFDVAAFIRCDIAVFSGMAMCQDFIKVNGPTISSLHERNIPILLLGTGGDKYNDDEKEAFGYFVEQIQPLAFISRDINSYNLFSNFVKNAFSGIDCGFFLPESYSPFQLVIPPYRILAFDSMPEPNIKNDDGLMVIRSHHCCFENIPYKYQHHGKTLISDIPYDYINIYSNAEEVHSDRVHACVAALSYGRKARLYHNTPRGSLFSVVDAENINKEIIQLDLDSLSLKKMNQIELVRQLIESVKI